MEYFDKYSLASLAGFHIFPGTTTHSKGTTSLGDGCKKDQDTLILVS